jgi:hypothetical protein
LNCFTSEAIYAVSYLFANCLKNCNFNSRCSILDVARDLAVLFAVVVDSDVVEVFLAAEENFLLLVVFLAEAETLVDYYRNFQVH